MRSIIGIFGIIIVMSACINSEAYSQNTICENHGCSNHERSSSSLNRNDFCVDEQTGESVRTLRNSDIADAAVQDAENQIHAGQCKLYVYNLLNDFCRSGVSGYCRNFARLGREVTLEDAVRGDIIQLSDREPFGGCHQAEYDEEGKLIRDLDGVWQDGMHTAVFLSHGEADGVVKVAHSNVIRDCTLCPWSCAESAENPGTLIYGNTTEWQRENPELDFVTCETMSIGVTGSEYWNIVNYANNNDLHVRVWRFGQVCEDWQLNAFTPETPYVMPVDPTVNGMWYVNITQYDTTDNAHLVIPVSNASTDYTIKMVYRRNDHLVRERLGEDYDEESSVAWVWEHRQEVTEAGSSFTKVQPFRKECTLEEKANDTTGECQDQMPPGRWTVDIYVYASCDHRDLDDEPNYRLTFDVEGNRFEPEFKAQVCSTPARIEEGNEHAQENFIYSCMTKAKNACYSETGECSENNAYEYNENQAVYFLFKVNEIWQDFRFRMYVVDLATGEGANDPFNQIKWWNVSSVPKGWRHAFYWPRVFKGGLAPGVYEIRPQFGVKDAITTTPTYFDLTEEPFIIIIK